MFFTLFIENKIFISIDLQKIHFGQRASVCLRWRVVPSFSSPFDFLGRMRKDIIFTKFTVSRKRENISSNLRNFSIIKESPPKYSFNSIMPFDAWNTTGKNELFPNDFSGVKAKKTRAKRAPQRTPIEKKRKRKSSLPKELEVITSFFETAPASASAPAPAPTSIPCQNKTKELKTGLIVRPQHKNLLATSFCSKKITTSDDIGDLIIGNEKAWASFSDWLKMKNEVREPRVILITGPPGIGKTSGTNSILKRFKFEITEVNASDVRTADRITAKVQDIAFCRTFGGAGALILDEIDGCHESGDTKIASRLIHLSKSRTSGMYTGPIICIANDSQTPTVKTLANSKHVKHFRMYRLSNSKMMELLREYILHTPSSSALRKLSPQQQMNLVQQSNGDARSLFNSCNFLSRAPKLNSNSNSNSNLYNLTTRDLTLELFRATEDIFYGTGSPAVRMLWADKYYAMDPFIMQCMVHENYPTALDRRNPPDKLHQMIKISEHLSTDDILRKEDFSLGLCYSSMASCKWPSPASSSSTSFYGFKKNLVKFSTLPGEISKISAATRDPQMNKLNTYEPLISYYFLQKIDKEHIFTGKKILLDLEVSNESFSRWWKSHFTCKKHAIPKWIVTFLNTKEFN